MQREAGARSNTRMLDVEAQLRHSEPCTLHHATCNLNPEP